jgi:hypothetical protein
VECPRGSETLSSQHEVKTIEKAEEWCRKPISEDDLPLTIHQDKTPNGRIRVKIFNDKGSLIVERG